jgi:hypothetical protein
VEESRGGAAPLERAEAEERWGASSCSCRRRERKRNGRRGILF